MPFKNIVVQLFLFVLIHPIFAQLKNDGSCYSTKNKLLKKLTKSNEENLRSDSIDISKYIINLDLIDFSAQEITGNCEIIFSPKLENITSLPLDLLSLTVDSVTSNLPVDYTYDGLMLKINSNTSLTIGEDYSVKIYYHGQPTVDGSGFGGFDFQSGIAYNLGIAFNDLPHNYGRSWFPCFDNFVERSSYEFNILTTGSNKSFAVGYLANETLLGGDTVVRKWIIDQEIPTYLAGVAISNYQQVSNSFSNISGTETPVLFVAKAADTTNMKNSFVHLQAAFDGFENYFGYYRWNKVGYVLTPVGAMEHPSLIAYPDFLANGNLSGERVMAHELAHHWFGNLITCSTPEDMWINEGHAEYLSYLFAEIVDGEVEYRTTVRNNHKAMLHTAHLVDGGYLTLNNIPENKTYGTHVYNKGADLVHTLRGYLGDSLFFNSLKMLCNHFEFKSLSTVDYMEYLNTLPDVNVSDYFNDWIFQPGWCQFSIDSFSTAGVGGAYNITIHIKQKLKAADHFYNNVPLKILLKNSAGEEYATRLFLSGEVGTYSFTSPINPVYINLNEDEKISSATTGETILISETGSNNISHADFILNVNAVVEPVYLRVEENWVAADPAINPAILVSPDRYWKVDGLNKEGLHASGKIYYDARNSNVGNIDVLLKEIINTNGLNEDSLKLFYRPNRTQDWSEYAYYSLDEIGTNTNGYASVEIDSLRFGEYALGVYDYPVAIRENKSNAATITVKPNPSKGEIIVENFDIKNNSTVLIDVFDATGKMVFCKPTQSKKLIIDTINWAKGIYFIGWDGGTERIKFVKE